MVKFIEVTSGGTTNYINVSQIANYWFNRNEDVVVVELSSGKNVKVSCTIKEFTELIST